MKNLFKCLVLAAALGSLFISIQPGFAQGTSFTYEGQLKSGGSPANGSYDLAFSLFNTPSGGAASAGPITNAATAVSNGLFTVTLDFGAGVFTGTNYWLDISVSPAGSNTFTQLSPRQPLTPVPYALYAPNAGGAAFATTAGSAAIATTASMIGGVASTNVPQLDVPNTTVQATGTVTVTSGFITGANVTSGGSGYTAAPLVTVSDVSGSNAVITATVSNGAVVSLAVQNAGNDYSAGATLIIAPPPSDAYQTFNSGNIFNGINTFSNASNTFVGSFSGTFGSFTGGMLTLTSNLNLPATTATAGIIYSGTNTLINAFGTNNFFAGVGAGNLTLTGNGNVGVGGGALQNITTGPDNSAFGYEALYNNRAGEFNAANGYEALCNNTTGGSNTANGNWALYHNTTGNGNAANGHQALFANTSGNYNTANGDEALHNNTTASDNTANGFHALFNNSTGSDNTANGYEALYNNTTASDNTATGFSALYANTTGIWNTAFGGRALISNTTGGDNTALGGDVLYDNTTGSSNTATGANALGKNSTGNYNTANGHNALLNNTTASDNTATGSSALYSNTTGSNNTAAGEGALYNNTNGGYNVAEGVNALYANTSGSNNIALGNSAGSNLTTESYSIDIGNPGLAGDNNTIRIGTTNVHTNAFIAGIYGATAASGVAVYVSSSGQLGTLTSSARFKQNIQSMGDASEALLALRPVTFRYKPGIDPKGLPQFGLVAEEVDQVDPDLVVRDATNGIYSVRYEAVNAMLLNEFLKQHRKVEQQNTEIQDLKQSVAELKKMVQSLARELGTRDTP